MADFSEYEAFLNAGRKSEEPASGVDGTDVVRYLDIKTWAEKDIPPPDKILGELVTTTTRMFLVGRTGLGKTLLGMGMAYAAARGVNFAHWECTRPVRVLYIDGEMPAELIKERARVMLGDSRETLGDGFLQVFAADTMEDFAARFPALGEFAPLNTEAGQLFFKGLIQTVGPIDLVIFDNVMSLITGDQKDEVPWSETLGLVSWLTSQRIGQIWLDHTGHNTDRQYGSATKAWRMDAVGLMAPLEGDTSDDLAFTLSFEHPGKARRRTPDNRQDFSTRILRLQGGLWTSEPVGRRVERPVKLRGRAERFYEALIRALDGHGRASVAGWINECIGASLIQRAEANESRAASKSRMGDFYRSKSELLHAKWIVIDQNTVTDLRGKWSA